MPFPPRRALAFLGCAALVLSLVACGGDDEAATTTSAAPSTTVALDDWREQVETGCGEWNERFAHLEGAEPATAEEAKRHTAEVHELASGLAEVLTDAGLPDDQRDDAEQLAELTDAMETATADLADAAADDDGAAIDAATERIDELGEELNVLAESLDVPACGGY